jgi:hypothetical protein
MEKKLTKTDSNTEYYWFVAEQEANQKLQEIHEG